MFQAMTKTGSMANRRRHARADGDWSAVLQILDQPIQCVVRNISAGGAKVRLDDAHRFGGAGLPTVDTKVVLTIDGLGDFRGKIVWTEAAEGGIKFSDDPIEVAEILEFAAAI